MEISLRWGGTMPLARLFEEAIHHARHGHAVTASQSRCSDRDSGALADQPGFADRYLLEGHPPGVGQRVSQPGLASLLERLAEAGLDDFYRGAIGHHLGAALQKAGSPLTSADLARHRSIRRRPLSLNVGGATVYNLPPPSQGLAALMILGLFERLAVKEPDGFAHLHGIVEATKQAFLVCHAHVTDPAYMTVHSTTYLGDSLLDRLASSIAPKRALPWISPANDHDTAWIGAIDGEGRAVSSIQSLGTPFGSGLAVGDFGLLWHNRGSAFALEAEAKNHLAPGRKPFHTLCPALARFRDGRVMVYGTSGGDGQPQTQAAIFTRYAFFGRDLQRAVTAPRWRLGAGGNAAQSSLKMEARFDPALVDALREAGHDIALVDPFDPQMGQAGAVLRHDDGCLEGATDPRSDGGVAGY